MLIFQVSKSIEIPGYIWINYPLSNHPWYLTIHGIQLSKYPWYPSIQVSMIFKYPWYPSIRILEKNGIHSSLVNSVSGILRNFGVSKQLCLYINIEIRKCTSKYISKIDLPNSISTQTVALKLQNFLIAPSNLQTHQFAATIFTWFSNRYFLIRISFGSFQCFSGLG